jgi:CDP-glycerol glycerophosphotransferase
MKLLNRIGIPIDRKECLLNNIKYQDGNLCMDLKFNHVSDLNRNSSILFYLTERSTKQALKFPVSIDHRFGGSSAISLKIQVSDYTEHFSNGIWDAFLQVENEGRVEKFRIINKLTDAIKTPPFYMKEQNKNFVPYATVYGKLSFKCEESTPILETESIVLERNGTLRINGFLSVPSWDVEKEIDINKQLIIRSRDAEEEITIDLNEMSRVESTTIYEQSKVNHYSARFAVRLDFRESIFGINSGIPYAFFIKYTFNFENVELPLTVPSSAVFTKTATFPTSEGVKNITIKEKQDSVFEILLKEENVHVEVDTVYSENDVISINGRIIAGEWRKQDSFEKSYIVVKKRTSDESYQYKLKIESCSFTYSFNLKDLIKLSAIFAEGIWDLYLQMDDDLYRMVTRLDGITNKQKLVTFPQHRLPNSQGNLLAIKPYYTLHNEVSILSRGYMFTKSVSKLEINKGRLLIEGKLHAHNPNEDLPSTFTGNLTIKRPYNKNFEFPVTLGLVKTEKAKFEFQFALSADLASEGLLEEKDTILRDINFDLISCEIYLEDGKVPLVMNVTPEKVVLTLEDRLKQTKKNRERLAKWSLRFYQLCNKILPVNRKAVIFQSFYGKSYSDNPKALYEEMLAEDCNMKAIWVLNNPKLEIPGNPAIVRPRSFKYYYYMAISKYFINNGNFPDFYVKRKGTVHLQTWHGTPLKKLGFDLDKNSLAYAENTDPALHRRIRRWDYLIGPNLYTSKILKRAYKFKKQMLNVGYPRNDIFYKENIDEIAKDVKEKLNIPIDKKVILYAPTWRDYEYLNGNPHKAYEFKFDLQAFKEQFGKDYVLLLRLHYFDASRINIHGFEGFVYNASSYEDISELYLISDLLITDYSSVMFDFANMSRPMIFFAFDLKRYGSQIRGFYINFKKEAPGPIVTNQQKLFDAIENIIPLQEQYSVKYEKFKEKFCHWEDGSASKRTIEAVFDNTIKKGEHL